MDALGSVLPPMVGKGDTANEQELQNLLINEKMQSERHKVNFQTLRADNLRYTNLKRFVHLSC